MQKINENENLNAISRFFLFFIAVIPIIKYFH